MVNKLGVGPGNGSVAPSRLVALAELAAPLEYAVALSTRPFLGQFPKGKRTVLVVPGFMANDASTFILRQELKRLGHHVKGWGQGVNIGPNQRIIDGLLDRLDSMAASTGRKVDVVGWSLGGVFARYLATKRTDLVSSVITLGSPIRPIGKRDGVAGRIFASLTSRHDADMGDFDPATRLKVPLTCVWTRTDGVVDWKAAATRPGPRVENIEVPGTHLGLGVNPMALHIIADRLALPDGDWFPYRPHPVAMLPPMRWFADADSAADGIWDDLDEDDPDGYISPLLEFPRSATG
ncbi:MAG: alpha/beta hydrolase [Actinobacteria bacterium]|nr:alpha/beta hydrolase [Actinomycetota bacterium]